MKFNKILQNVAASEDETSEFEQCFVRYKELKKKLKQMKSSQEAEGEQAGRPIMVCLLGVHLQLNTDDMSRWPLSACGGRSGICCRQCPIS